MSTLLAVTPEELEHHIYGRPYGEINAEEKAKIDQGKCALGKWKGGCSTAVCSIFGKREWIESEGEILRPDGGRAWCAGCSDDRTVACARNVCSKRCDLCHEPFNVTDAERILKDSVPAVCGQKHAFPRAALKQLGGLEYDNAMATWIPPRKLPQDRFICGLNPGGAMVRKWVAEASKRTGHKSWMVPAKGLFPKPPKDLRKSLGVPEDHFLALNFRIKDRILEDMWIGDRLKFFDWLATQNIDAVFMVNFSPWGDLPRFNTFMMLKRMFICYKEMSDRGIPTVMEFEVGNTWAIERYLEGFRKANQIKATHTSWQIGGYKLSGNVLYRHRQIAKAWAEDGGVVAFTSGASTPKAALMQKAAFKPNEIYVSNADVYVSAGHWKIPPGVKVNRTKMEKPEIFAAGVGRWRGWTDQMFGPEQVAPVW